MHTGIISFCDRVRYNIKSSETKDSILNDIERRYNIRILQRHWFRLDETTSGQLHKSPHWACLRSNGNPYYMYLTKFDDVNIIFFVDKKVQPGYEKPRIILGRGMFADDLFNDTILDGEMVRRTTATTTTTTDLPDSFVGESGWIFLINDVIAYCGKSLTNVPLPKRIECAYDMFHNKYKPDPLFDVCTFSIKKYTAPTKDAIDGLIELSKTLPYTNRGVYLWSHNSRIKPKLYNFDDGLIKSVHRKVKDCPDFRDRNDTVPEIQVQAQIQNKPEETNTTTNLATVIPNTLHITDSDTRISTKEEMMENEKILWLRKTENPDIYDIYTTQQCSEKLGIAYVQTLTMSKRLRAVFKDQTVAISIPYVCSYSSQFEKWTPLRPATDFSVSSASPSAFNPTY